MGGEVAPIRHGEIPPEQVLETVSLVTNQMEAGFLRPR